MCMNTGEKPPKLNFMLKFAILFCLIQLLIPHCCTQY